MHIRINPSSKLVVLVHGIGNIPSMPNKEQVIRDLKREQGDGTAFELAKRMDVSPAFISMVINGQKEPGPKMLEFLGYTRHVVTTYRKSRKRDPQNTDRRAR